jgi:hypothetical protein
LKDRINACPQDTNVLLVPTKLARDSSILSVRNKFGLFSVRFSSPANIICHYFDIIKRNPFLSSPHLSVLSSPLLSSP